MEAYVIYISNEANGHRWYLGKNVETGRAVWISEWIVTKPMADVYPLVYKQRTDAETTARKIGNGAATLALKLND